MAPGLVRARPARGLGRAVVTVGVAAALGSAFASPALAQGTNSKIICGNVKPSSRHNFTSWYIQTNANDVTVKPPAGGTAARDPKSNKHWHVTSPPVPPGGQICIQLNRPAPNKPKGTIVAGDYQGPDGKTRWVGPCADPVGVHVQEGGSMYMGMAIPAGEYLYVYQPFKTPTEIDSMISMKIKRNPADGAHGLVLLPDHFDVPIELMAMDLYKPGLPANASVTHYMEDVDATPGPALPNNCMLTADALQMTFPNGMMAGQTVTPCAFLSPNRPGFTQRKNVSSVHQGGFGCGKDYSLVPQSGTESTGGIHEPDPTVYADCNEDGALTVADFLCFQTQFALGTGYADCNEDDRVTVADLLCFQSAFARGYVEGDDIEAEIFTFESPDR